MPEQGPERNADQAQRMSRIDSGLDVLREELLRLQGFVQFDELSPEAERYGDIVNLSSAFGTWREIFEQRGQIPEEHLIALEKELERLQKNL